MNEKDNMKDSLLVKSAEKNLNLFPVSRHLFFEDTSNSQSIRNSEALSENNEDTKSDKDVNSLEAHNNNYGDNLNINYYRCPNKYYSHKAMNTFFKFRKSKIYEEEENKSRESYSVTYSKVWNFSKKTHYILYMCNLLSFSVNYEAIWRFPYYFFLSEGAIFFIPFFLFYFLLGIPVLTLESSLGQIFKLYPDSIVYKMKKDHKYNFSIMTVKILILGVSYIITIYFGSLVSQIIHYFFLAFSSELPWKFQLGVDKLYNSNFYKNKFFVHDSTHQNFDIFRLGEINYHKLISTFIFWFIFYLILIFRMDITKHKFIYRILCFGPIIIVTLIFISCIHPRIGFIQGCIYFLIPKMEKLLNYKPWLCGINQAIFSLMLGNGKNFYFSTTIKENDNVYSRSTVTSLVVLFLGIFCTFFCSIYAGLIAEELNLDNINQIPFNSSNLPFVTYLLALGMMKHNRFFSFIFLFSLIIIGYHTLYLLVSNLSMILQKSFDKYLNNYTSPLLICSINFILCIPYTKYQGQFFLELIDRYISFLPIVFIVLYEILLVNDKIGINLLIEIISNKTGIVLPLYIFYFTKYITPFVMIIMIIFAFVYQCNNKQNSILTIILEWIFLLSPFIVFLFFFIRDWKNEKYGRLKKLENNILKNEIFINFPKRKNERKGTEMITLNNDHNKKTRNASFSNRIRLENNYILSDDAENLSEENDSTFNKDNEDNEYNSVDYNSISVRNNKSRKQTIDMEIINNNHKNT